MSQQGRILLTKYIRWLDYHLMFKDKCHTYTTLSSSPERWAPSYFHYLCIVTNFPIWSFVVFSFDAFIWADAVSWAHKHSCNQTTWILPLGENRSVWCVGNRSPAVDSSVYTWPWLLLCACAEQVCTANTLNSHYSGTKAMSVVLLIYLSYYTRFETSLHRVITPGCF